MKTKGIFALVVLTGLIFACKQNVDPTLIVTVQDTLGVNLENARVITDPCMDPGSPCEQERININFIKEGFTNAAGQVTFEFPYSAIIDIAGQWVDCDTTGVDTTSTGYCLYIGRTVARFETKEVKKGEKNETNVLLVLRPE